MLVVLFDVIKHPLTQDDVPAVLVVVALPERNVVILRGSVMVFVASLAIDVLPHCSISA